MDKYMCEPCGYIYDPEAGDPDNGIAPGTAFENIPEDWVCPICGLGKDVFVKMQRIPIECLPESVMASYAVYKNCQPERVPGIFNVRPDTSDAAAGRTPPGTGRCSYYKPAGPILQEKCDN